PRRRHPRRPLPAQPRRTHTADESDLRGRTAGGDGRSDQRRVSARLPQHRTGQDLHPAQRSRGRGHRIPFAGAGLPRPARRRGAPRRPRTPRRQPALHDQRRGHHPRPQRRRAHPRRHRPRPRLRSLAGLGRARPGDRSRTVSDREPDRVPDLRGARRRSRRRPRPRRLQGDVTRLTPDLITAPTETPTTAPAEATTEDPRPAPTPTRPRRLQGDVTRMTTDLITDPTETPTTAPAEATTEDASPAPSPTRGSIVKLTAASARVAIRPLDVDRDTARVHEWLSHPRAHYWMMTDLDEAGVRAYLEGIRDSAEEAGWVGSVD